MYGREIESTSFTADEDGNFICYNVFKNRPVQNNTKDNKKIEEKYEKKRKERLEAQKKLLKHTSRKNTKEKAACDYYNNISNYININLLDKNI